MSVIISKVRLQSMSNEELMSLTKDHAVRISMYDGKFDELCVNDFQGFDPLDSSYFTSTDIRIKQKYVQYLEIL